MAKKLWSNCLIIILLLSICATGFSQEVSTENSKTVYVTLNDIKLRETPPSKGLIFVSGPGEYTFDLKKGAQVIILEKRSISTVFSKTIWVRVRDLESKKEEGWMYWGDKEDESVNLKLKG